jgi:hypothetical protein
MYSEAVSRECGKGDRGPKCGRLPGLFCCAGQNNAGCMGCEFRTQKAKPVCSGAVQNVQVHSVHDAPDYEKHCTGPVSRMSRLVNGGIVYSDSIRYDRGIRFLTKQFSKSILSAYRDTGRMIQLFCSRRYNIFPIESQINYRIIMQGDGSR